MAMMNIMMNILGIMARIFSFLSSLRLCLVM